MLSFSLRRHAILGALAAGKLVQGRLEVLAQLDAARVELQVRRTVFFIRLEENRVIERVVAVGALQAALGVDIPRAVEAALSARFTPESLRRWGEMICPVVCVRHCSSSQPAATRGVSRSVCTSRGRLPQFWLVGSWMATKFLGQLALGVESLRVPGIGFAGFLDDAAVQTGWPCLPSRNHRLAGRQCGRRYLAAGVWHKKQFISTTPDSCQSQGMG